MLFHSIINFTTPDLAKGIKIITPASGQVFNIEELDADHSFYKHVGAAVAIKIEGHHIHSPIKGTVTSIIPSNGKVIIQAKNKLRFLIQFDNSYSQHHGVGIKFNVSLGQTVDINQSIMTIDLYKMQHLLKPLYLYFALLDTKAFKSVEVSQKHVQIGVDPIFSLVPKPIKKK